MFEVLNFVYENYWYGDTCPELPVLQRKLRAVGFDSSDIQEALIWIEELKQAVLQLPAATDAPAELPTLMHASSAQAVRLLSQAEQQRLDQAAWGFLIFLVSVSALSPQRYELVMERVMATTNDIIGVDELKLIVLMMFWSLGEEPDALILDELCDNHEIRIRH